MPDTIPKPGPSLPPTKAWVGHPYCDVIDNRTDFESKIRRVIEAVCKRLGGRLGVDIDDRLQAQSKKRKFLVKSLPDIKVLVGNCRTYGCVLRFQILALNFRLSQGSRTLMSSTTTCCPLAHRQRHEYVEEGREVSLMIIT